MQRVMILFALLLLNTKQVSPQNTIGIPKIINFSHEQMSAGTQNWAIDQDRFGTMYVANNRGLITYNGKEWKLFRLPHKTIARSVLVHSSGKIFVGGQDEFGYFFPDESGTLKFHSLNQLVPDNEKEFGDVWNIVAQNHIVFFRTGSRIFVYDGKYIKSYEAKTGSEWANMSSCFGKIYACDFQNTLFQYISGKFLPAASSTSGIGNVRNILEYGKDSMMITTLKSGIFIYTGSKFYQLPIDKKIISSQIYSSAKINDEMYALGTVSNGVYFINKNGYTIRHISASNGLSNNIVLSVFIDKEKNIWTGLDDGLSLINSNSAFQYIHVGVNSTIASYAINVFKNNLYIGTSDGLFFSKLTKPAKEDLSFSQGSFEKIPGTDGQVWSLESIGNKLFMGHHEGAFIIDKELTSIFHNGAWIFRKLPGKNIVTGSYKGLYFIKGQDSNLSIFNHYHQDVESLRFVEIDSVNRTIWASHPIRGIYKFSTDSSLQQIRSMELLDSKAGLPSDLENFVFKIDSRVIFATQKGIYLYNFKTKRFSPHPEFIFNVGKMPIFYLRQDSDNKIWFVTDNKVAVLDRRMNKVTFLPELTDKLVAGFNYIYPLNNKNIFFGSNSGVIHLNYDLYNALESSPEILFNKIISIGAGKDSLIHNGYFISNHIITAKQAEENIPQLPPNNNSIHFEYASSNYINNSNVQYAYKLEGFDTEWSEWSVKNEKDYTNLPHGRYIFKVKAKNNLRKESPEIAYSFSIRPFWYQTVLANIIYAIFFILAIFAVIRGVRRKLIRERKKFEKEQQQMKYLHELEIEHNEREIINLKNQNLETEIKYKNKELATITMNLYKRSRLLTKLREDITSASKKLSEKEQRKDLTKVIKLISETEKQNNDWEQFSMHFDDVHNNFLKRMKENYPELTPADLKICAYLKINLSSKEIAQILSISLKGVEIARYRLRKKLNLPTGVNLVSFLNEV